MASPAALADDQGHCVITPMHLLQASASGGYISIHFIIYITTTEVRLHTTVQDGHHPKFRIGLSFKTVLNTPHTNPRWHRAWRIFLIPSQDSSAFTSGSSGLLASANKLSIAAPKLPNRLKVSITSASKAAMPSKRSLSSRLLSSSALLGDRGELQTSRSMKRCIHVQQHLTFSSHTKVGGY